MADRGFYNGFESRTGRQRRILAFRRKCGDSLYLQGFAGTGNSGAPDYISGGITYYDDIRDAKVTTRLTTNSARLSYFPREIFFENFLFFPAITSKTPCAAIVQGVFTGLLSTDFWCII